MKKFFLFLAASAAVSAQAASFSAVDVQAKVSISAKCDAATCNTTVKGIYSLSTVIAVSQGERDQFDSNTKFVVYFEALLATFTLGDDPNYSNGDTSANVTISDEFSPGVAREQTVSLDWSSGNLEISASSKFGGTTTTPADHSPRKTLLDVGNAKSATDKDHTGYPQDLNVSAETGGAVSIFASTAETRSDYKKSDKQTSNVDGTVQQKASASIKNSTFENSI